MQPTFFAGKVWVDEKMQAVEGFQEARLIPVVFYRADHKIFYTISITFIMVTHLIIFFFYRILVRVLSCRMNWIDYIRYYYD